MTEAPPRSQTWTTVVASLVWVGLSIYLYQRGYPQSPLLLPMIPLGLLALWMAVRQFEGFLFSMVFLVPLSVNLTDVGAGLGIALPAELFLFLAAIGILASVFQRRLNVLPFLNNPIGIVILLQFAWAIVTTIASERSQVSVKFLFAHGTYILVYYVGFGSLMMQEGRIAAFFKNYSWGLVPVMIWAIIHLSQYGLSRKFSPVMAEPFFDDHTVFGACLAMLLPMSVWLARHGQMRLRLTGAINWAWPILALVLVAMLLSFSRAAWLSIGVIAGMYFLLRMRLRFRFFVFALLLAAGGAWIQRDAIVRNMEQNENVSGEDVLSTAASITNVSSDDSNKERLNRWACAVRMFQHRPWLGYGPGSYEKEYGNFQVLREMTRISTFQGDRGDAHSEYLGVLAEQGVLGLIFLGGLFLMSIRIGMQIIYHSPVLQHRGLAMAILLGLSTYYFHGFVNDFLDLDKAAALFWGMLGALAAMTPRHANPPSNLQPLQVS